MGFLRRLFGGPKASRKAPASWGPGAVQAGTVTPAALDSSYPTLPVQRRYWLSTAETNALPFEATVCPTCGVDVAKPPKGRKKCASCGVYMFVVVVDRARRRLVKEADQQAYWTSDLARAEKEGAKADKEWRAAMRAAGFQVARNEDEETSLDVVGESHYQRDLASLKLALGSGPDGGDVETAARLIREPSNKHDKNAVQVLIHGRLVGYLSRDDASYIQPWLKRHERSGQPVFVAATIGGGYGKGGYLSPIGVTLDNLPDTVEG